MNEFLFVVVWRNGERETWKIESLKEMFTIGERLLESKEVNHILIDFQRISSTTELRIFASGIQYFKNYLFNIR